MGTETSRKRHASGRGRFVWMMGKKIGLYALAVCLLSAGLLFVRITHEAFYIDGSFCVIYGSLTAAMLWCSNRLYIKASVIEPVRPIDTRDAHLLPLQETLVRASDGPSTEPQTELLRAARQGPEMPAEQLLRAHGMKE